MGEAFSPNQRRKVRLILAALVVPLAVVTAIFLVIMWPRGESLVGSIPINAPGVERTTGVITSIGQTDEMGQTPVTMETSGTDVPVHVPYEIVLNGLSVGDEIRATFNPYALETGTPYIFSDFVRSVPLWLLIGIYLLSVLVVARLKGLMAMVGLGVSLAVVGVFILPALMAGKVDMIAACITVTEERKQKVLFSEPYYTGGIAALVRL